MTLHEWLQTVLTDKHALARFDSTHSEERIVKGYRELLSGYAIDPTTILNETRLCAKPHKGLVTIQDINFYSLCGHHFLPFFGTIDITYEPGAKIIGLGKFPRLVQAYARRFQIQEDLVKEIAEEIMASGKARGTYVTSRARHLCMCSRGPNDPTVTTMTNYGLGSLENMTHGNRTSS